MNQKHKNWERFFFRLAIIISIIVCIITFLSSPESISVFDWIAYGMLWIVGVWVLYGFAFWQRGKGNRFFFRLTAAFSIIAFLANIDEYNKGGPYFGLLCAAFVWVLSGVAWVIVRWLVRGLRGD